MSARQISMGGGPEWGGGKECGGRRQGILSAAKVKCCQVIPVSSSLPQQFDKEWGKSANFFCTGPDSK